MRLTCQRRGLVMALVLAASPAVRERLVSQGAEVHTMSPSEFSAFYERDRKQWAGVVAQSGAKID